MTSIGEQAFTGCSKLKSIQVATGNKIYDSRENSNAVIKTGRNQLIVGCKNTKIPPSVASIRAYAFRDCSGLKRIEIPPSVTSIGKYAFWGCSGLERIKIPASVTNIRAYAFGGCSGLEGMEISPNVTSVGGAAFYGCENLKKMTILNPRINLSYKIFDMYGLINFKNPVVTIKGYKDSTAQVFVDDLNSYYQGHTIFRFVALEGAGGNTVTPKPDQNKTPDKGTILKSKNTTYKVTKKGAEVDFTKISSAAASVTIPAMVRINGVDYKVTSISANAFKGNKKLSKVTIGANITSIGKNAFSGCKNLKSMIIKSQKLKSVGQNAFKSISPTAKIKVPSKQLKAYKKLLKGKGQGKKAKITK